MSRKRALGAVALLLAVTLLLGAVSLAAASAPTAFSLQRWVLGGGGGHAAGGVYTLDSTAGQGVAGLMWGGVYEACSGFWCGTGVARVYMPAVLRAS
jgi:hypothetical protein